MSTIRLEVDTLRQARLFQSLTEAECEALRLCFRGRHYGAGDVVFVEGEPGNCMILVSEGSLIATTQGPGAEVRELGRMGPGEVAGEMAFLDPAPRSATVIAIAETTAWELGHDTMDVLRQNAPSAARAVVAAALKSVAIRLRRLDQRIEQELDR